MAEELDLSGHFSAEYTPPEPVTSEEAARDIDHLGLIGEKALKDKGFFTRLVVEDRTSSGRILNPSNVRVLIVDDDESTALLIQRALHSRAKNAEPKLRAGFMLMPESGASIVM